MANQTYIPALRFHWLTNIYDSIIGVLMPEKSFKTTLIKNAGIRNNYRVLDFGTGTATLSIMAYHSNPMANYTGIDIDEKILNLARLKIGKQGAKIKLLKYNGGTLPFENNSIDRIISSLVIHHLTTEQKSKAFKEFKRILKHTGELHIADWGRASNILMRSAFHLVQFLDGYKTTNDNVKGKLPIIIKEAGFNNVIITQKFNTLLGTIEIFKVK